VDRELNDLRQFTDIGERSAAHVFINGYCLGIR
jgi:hypothetical protein